MSLSTAKDTIRYYMSQDDEYELIEFNFFGGEPMLAFPLITDTIEWFFSKKWDKDSAFLITTNGTILNEEMKGWLFRNRKKVNIAFSIDGIPKAHNINRNNSYDLLSPNIYFFMNNWPDQSAKMTINAESIPYVAESVIHLEEMGLKFTANISHEDMWGQNKDELLAEYEHQLSLLVDFYAANSNLEPLDPILNSFPNYLGLDEITKKKRMKDFSQYCGAGFQTIAVDIDGTQYPCQRFIPWISGKPAPGKDKFRKTPWKPKKCIDCKLLLSCPTCIARNWIYNNEFSYRTTFHCETFKLEVLASARLQAIKIQKFLEDKTVNLTQEEARQQKIKLDSIFELIEEGI